MLRPLLGAGQSMLGTELPAKFDGRRTGFGLGISLRAEIRPWMALRTALRYEQQGGIVERDLLGPADGPVHETAKFQFDYLTTPLLVDVRSPHPVALNLRPSFYFGPSLEMNLRSKAIRNDRTGRAERCQRRRSASGCRLGGNRGGSRVSALERRGPSPGLPLWLRAQRSSDRVEWDKRISQHRPNWGTLRHALARSLRETEPTSCLRGWSIADMITGGSAYCHRSAGALPTAFLSMHDFQT